MSQENQYSDRQLEMEGLNEHEIHRLLSSERRRVTLDVLADYEFDLGLDRLAEYVATREADASDEVSGEDVERVAITLHHNHLPRMADVGLVDYDPEARLIEAARVSVDPTGEPSNA